MNEQQAKALFMAQYLGQKVFRKQHWNDTEVLFTTWLEQSKYPDTYLQLRSIADLTDGEKFSIKIATDKIFDWAFKNFQREAAVERYKYECGIIEHAIMLQFGILLDFTYLNDNNEPITLTSTALIDKTWAVLAK